MKIAVYPGTFDPLTNGHYDLIARASTLFDRVIIAVAQSPSKNTLFNMEERVQLIEEACVPLSNVFVSGFTGLLTDFVAKENANILIRGLRTTVDFEYELGLTSMYRRLSPNLECLFLTPSEQFAFLSSTLVRDMAIHGGDTSAFVPKNVFEAIERKMAYKD